MSDGDARQQVAAVILCGGEGRRMQGQDKGRVLYRGRPLVEWVLQCVQPQVLECCISANRSLDQYQGYGLPVLTDRATGYGGPLAGVTQALAWCRTRWLLVVPCDTPALPADLAQRLLDAVLQHGAAAAYAVDAEREHPVIHLVQGDLLPQLSVWRRQGGTAVRGWLASLGAVPVLFDNAAAFRNLNSSAELEP